MSSTVVTSSRTRGVLRDPVLLGPVVVGAGLAAGWLGADAGASGSRVATDIALSWALVAASVVALDRARWRRTRALLAVAAFALLAADLQWASSHTLWTLGFLLEGLWGALLVHLVLTFPEGRAWSRAGWITIAGAYTAASGGQFVGALVLPDSRDVLSVAPQQAIADAVDRAQEILGIAVALAVAFLIMRRLLALGGPARRAQAPLLVASGLIAPAAAFWLGWASVTAKSAPTIETIGSGRFVARPARGDRRDRLVPATSTRGVPPRRRAANGGSDRPPRATRPASSVTRRSRLRIASTRAATSTPPDIRSSSRTARIGRSRW